MGRKRIKKRSKFTRFIYSLFIFFLALGIFGAAILAFWFSTLKIPDFKSFENRKVIQSTKIYDRTGEVLLWDIHEDIRRTVVSYDDISRHLKNATVAIEDSNFYNHNGVDFFSIARAMLVNIRAGKIKQGASTISQQLIKNAFLTNEKLWSRKIKEIVMTLKLEKDLGKDKILDLYLNEIPYGGNIYGAEAASQGFFSKPASQLTLAESAYLAALPQAPTYYSPYGNHREDLEARKNLVLQRMLDLGFINEEERTTALAEEIEFESKDNQSLKAPHFSIFIRSYLEQKYGKDRIEQDGLKVITTLNYDLQQKAEELVAKYAEENTKNFNATNAALISIDPKTGQILTMVGSKDYFNREDQGNFNVSLAYRQPGSSIKPFIYATAFKKGYNPDTIVFDLETEFDTSCNPDHTLKNEGGGVNNATGGEEKCYHPKNYDNIFRGPVRLRDALAQSINVPAVKVLYLAGMKNSLSTISDMGINSLNDPDRYGLTLVLGGGEVSLLELTAGYSVFGNNGVRNNTTGILEIKDANGNILEKFEPSPKQAISKNIALMISDVLSDNEARTPAFGERSWLYFPDRDVAAKTGTTNNYRDAWVIGYTPNFATGVWCGNNDNTSMEKKVAGFIAAPLWNAFLLEVFKDLPKEEFEEPEKPKPVLSEDGGEEITKPFLNGEWKGGITYNIDKISGKLATEFTPKELVEKKVITEIHNILYWIDKNNPLGPQPEDPTKDSQFLLWEYPVRKWVQEQHIQEQTIDDIPKDYDDAHTPENIPQLTPISPIMNAIVNPKNTLNIKFFSKSKYELAQTDFYLGNSYLGSVTKKPFELSVIPSLFIDEGLPGTTIRIITYDTVRNKAELNILIWFNQ